MFHENFKLINLCSHAARYGQNEDSGSDIYLSATIPKKMKMHIAFKKKKRTRKAGAPGKQQATQENIFKVYSSTLQLMLYA